MQLQVEYRYLQNEWLIPHFHLYLNWISLHDVETVSNLGWFLTDTGFMNKDELAVALSLYDKKERLGN